MEVKCSRATGAGSTISQEKALPTGWRSEQLGPHVDIRSGESPSLFSFQTTGIPYFKVEQLNGANKYLSETPYFINVERPVAAGSIIFPKRGASILLNKIRLLQTPGYMDTNLMSLTPRKAIYGEYLFYWLGHKGLAQFADVTSIPQINNKHIAPLRVQFPEDTEEQRKIAEALANADALIDSLEQLLTKKRQIKQGAMQELLTGKRRLPEFQQSWSEVRLGEIGRTYGGLTGKGKADFGHGASKYITFMNVMTTVRTSTEMIESVQVGPSESQNMVQAGDLLFNGSSETPEEVALCSWVENCDDGVFLNSFCFGFRPFTADRLSGLFMAYFFRGRPGRAAVSALAQGATRYNIAKTALLHAPLRLPSFAEQQAIAEVLSSMDAEITAFETRLTKARALKQAMAQALLTGRIRLVEPTA